MPKVQKDYIVAIVYTKLVKVKAKDILEAYSKTNVNCTDNSFNLSNWHAIKV